MPHHPLTHALIEGDTAALRAQVKPGRSEGYWEPPHAPGHPLWALVEAMGSRAGASSVPWKEAMEVFWEAGCPINPRLHLAASTWKNLKPKARAPFAAGTDAPLRADDSASASLLYRAVRLGCTPMAEALLARGADPMKVYRRVHMNRVDAHEVAWHAVQETTPQELVGLLVAHSHGALPELGETVEWLNEAGGKWAPDHPVWALMPDMGDAWAKTCAEAVHHCRWHRGGDGLAAWWLARPQDRAGLTEATLRRDNPDDVNEVAQCVLLACGRSESPTLLDEELGPEGALTRLTLRLEGAKHQEYWAVPALQWLRHRSARSFPEAVRADLLRRLEAHQPNWGASFGAALTEGELATLSRNSPLHDDPDVWKANPDWLAPNPHTGRTPLWYAHTGDEAQVWWERGCSLKDVDAEGNEVMALLTARAMKRGRDGTSLANWCLARLKDGSAPLNGHAWGQDMQAWVLGRQDLAAAWAKRKGPVAAPAGDGLWVQAIRMNRTAVEKLLAAGASPAVRDRQGRPLVEAVLDLPKPTGLARDNRWAIIHGLLEAGAPYVLSDGQTLLARCVSGWKDRNWAYRDWIDRLIAEHDRQGAAWTPVLTWKTLQVCRTNCSLRGPWTHLPESVRSAWLDYLLDPTRMPPSDRAMSDRLKMLHELLPRALADCGWVPRASVLAPWRAALSADRPLLQKQWDRWADLPAAARSQWEGWLMDEALMAAPPAPAEGLGRPRFRM